MSPFRDAVQPRNLQCILQFHPRFLLVPHACGHETTLRWKSIPSSETCYSQSILSICSFTCSVLSITISNSKVYPSLIRRIRTCTKVILIWMGVYLCWMSHARPHAAALLRNVDPSTENGRAELFSVTVGGGPPRFPADAQTPAFATEVAAAAAVDVVVVFLLSVLVFLAFLVPFPFFAVFVATTVAALEEDVFSTSPSGAVVPVVAPATLHQPHHFKKIRSVNFVLSNIWHKKILCKNAPNRVVSVITRISLSSRITDLSWRKSPRLDRIKRISTNRSNLNSQVEGDLFIDRSGIGRGRILMLTQHSNLRILGSLSAENRCKTNLSCIPFEGS